VWKAAVTIDLPLYFNSQSVVFTTEDMQRICKTFLSNLHQGDGRWNAWLGPEPDDMAARTKQSGGLLCLTQFMELCQFDARVRELLEEMVATHPEVGGWLRSTYAIKAYAYRLKHPGFNDRRTAESLTFPAQLAQNPGAGEESAERESEE
jgi:hypothetical protein